MKMAHSEAASAPSFSSSDSRNIDHHVSRSQIANPQTVSLGFMQSMQSPPQIRPSNLIQVTYPVPNQFTNPPSMAHQPSQYPMQPIPSNYHFQSNPQPVPQYVPVQQTSIYVAKANTVAWTTGLFDCFDDPVNGVAFLSFFNRYV